MPTRFSDDEVRDILQRAIERGGTRGDSTGQDELVEIAAELGVSAEDVSAAIAEVTQARELEREMAAIKEQRRRSLGSSLVTWFLVCSLLFVIDWMTGPDWWVMWPCAIWALVLVLGARRAYFPDRASLESRAHSRLEKRRKKEEREHRKRRHIGFEQGLEQALERGVAALVEAAARHVDRVTSDSAVRRDQRPRRVEPMGGDGVSPFTEVHSNEERDAPRRHRR